MGIAPTLRIMRPHRGNFFVLFFGAALATACGSSASSSVQQAKDGIISAPAFNVWECTDLECLNLETLETSAHTFTACASVLEDAQQVGVGICESHKSTSEVSRPATCLPLGSSCAASASRAAYRLGDSPAKPAADGGASPDAARNSP